ncbi:hypothetical protein HID58_033117, partial [Brassica napus]
KVRECRENSFWISLRKSFLSRELSRFVLERCICSHKGLTDSIYPHGNQSYVHRVSFLPSFITLSLSLFSQLAQQKGKCSCKYISGGIFKVKARRLCSARGAKVQKLLDFGEVKISYISFFDIKKHETVNSRWDLELGQEQMRVETFYWFDIGKEKEVKLVKKCLGKLLRFF